MVPDAGARADPRIANPHSLSEYPIVKNKTDGAAVARAANGQLLPGHHMGRPAGTSQIERFRQLVAPDWPAVVAKTVELAKAGDTRAIEILTLRMVPPARPTPRAVAIPGLKEAEGLEAKALCIVAAGADGLLAPKEVKAWLGTLADVGKILEISSLQARMREIERQLGLAKGAAVIEPAAELV